MNTRHEEEEMTDTYTHTRFLSFFLFYCVGSQHRKMLIVNLKFKNLYQVVQFSCIVLHNYISLFIFLNESGFL